ncbi:hypothetical protein C8N43_3903 [Litoreibacter ponti]|uniref:Trypsin-like peptidase n=1 Tax=Litoreibacter ponti TaxID=1510457 RepID=A0A2T6BCR8_9RHOB|nr:hypothetical protein [Litoreibacter ponti]PTX53860.1 hypothetical protein C8N43_3903 [Litoreibacter ponti]
MTRIPVQTLRRCLPRIEQFYRQTPGLLLVGLAEKEVAGSRAGILAVVFVVRKKRANPKVCLPSSVELSRFDPALPKESRVATDVVERKMDEALLTIDGADIIRSEKLLDHGTLGLVLDTRDGSGRVWGITNAHVLAPPEADVRTHQVESNSFSPMRIIGQVFAHSRLKTSRQNTVDLALIDVDERLSNAPLAVQGAVQRLAGFRTVSEAMQGGSRRQFSYRSNGQEVICHKPKLLMRKRLRHPDGTPLEFVSFYQLDVSPASPDRPRGGHSGSLLLTSIGDRSYGAGLVFAGSANSVLVYGWSTIRGHLRRWVPGIGS